MANKEDLIASLQKNKAKDEEKVRNNQYKYKIGERRRE